MSVYLGEKKVGTIYTPPKENDYVRPSDWLPIPITSGDIDEIYILNGVGNNCINKLYLYIGSTFTIDWGDGTVETYSQSSTISHTYDYNDLPESSWTNHNMTRQALVHITANRGAITQVYFSSSSYSYTNADGYSVQFNNSNCSTDIYEIKGNVSSCTCSVSSSTSINHLKLESFVWIGNITSSGFNMFIKCTSLQKVSFDASNMTSLSSIFMDCKSLRIAPTLDTSNCTSFSSMFLNCSALKKVPKYNTEKSTNFSYMFSGCTSLTEAPEFNCENATTMSGMFYNCSSLKIVPKYNTKKVTNFSSMFFGCYNLEKIPELNCSSAKNLSNFVLSNYLLTSLKLYNINPSYSSSITISSLSESKMISNQQLLDLFNSIAPNSNNYVREINIGVTLQSRLTNIYVKDSDNFYTTILPTEDTTIQSGKTYYTYNMNTDEYTQCVPDFSSDIIYYENITATWNTYEICQSTDTGAMLILDFVTNVKGYTVS